MTDDEFDSLWSNCDWRKEIDSLREKNESLKRERAMLVEALKSIDSCLTCENDITEAVYNKYAIALSATEQQSSAWLNEKRAEVLMRAAELCGLHSDASACECPMTAEYCENLILRYGQIDFAGCLAAGKARWLGRFTAPDFPGSRPTNI